MSRPLRAPSTPAETHSTPTPIPRPSYQPTPSVSIEEKKKSL